MRDSEIKNGRLGLYGAEHSKCDRIMTLGFKGLNTDEISSGHIYINSMTVSGDVTC